MSDQARFAKDVAAAAAADLAASPSVARAVKGGRFGHGGLRNLVLRDITGQGELFPRLRKMLLSNAGSGLGAEAATTALPTNPWAAVAGAIASAAATVYSVKLTNDATQDIAKIQANAQATALKAAQLQAQTAALQVQGGSPAPSWVAPVAVGGATLVLGGVFYLMTRRGRR